jgi:ATP adenylyltransferase
MEQVIWAPWRMEFIENPKQEGCVFCNAIKTPPSDWKSLNILDLNENVLVIMNKYPYVNGHLLIIPTAHVSSLNDLSMEQFNNLNQVLRNSIQAISTAMGPQGFNVGMNLGQVAGAGIADHLHYHIVPRWNGDNNFMPVIGNTRVMPQHIDETYERLLPHFKNICNLT